MSFGQDDVVAGVRTIIAEHLGRDAEITLETQLVADLGIDSLGVMEVVADIEDKFELTIADAELREVTSMGDVVSAITTRLRKDGRLSE